MAPDDRSLLAWNSGRRNALIGKTSTLDTILSLRILQRLHRMVTGVLFPRARHADPGGTGRLLVIVVGSDALKNL